MREFLKANTDVAADIEKAVRGAKAVIEEELLVGPSEGEGQDDDTPPGDE